MRNVALCVEVFDKQEGEFCTIRPVSQHNDVGRGKPLDYCAV